MAEFSVPVRVRVAWWVIPYLHILEFFCFVMESEPNIEKVIDLVERHGLKVEIGDIVRTES